MNRREAIRKTGWTGSALLMTPMVLSLLNSCKSEPRLDWDPQFFTLGEADFVHHFVDLLLPTTDTPGALDVKVDIFIDRLAAHIYDAKEQQRLRDNIEEFNADCISTFGQEFAQLNRENQIKVFERAEKQGGKFNSGVWGTAVGKQEPVSFYRNLKSTAIWAYFTTEEIGERVLSYDPFPGDYRGCISLADVGRRWSL